MDRKAIFSRLQETINDLEFKKIQKEEYIQIYSSVINELAMICEYNLVAYNLTISAQTSDLVITSPRGIVYKIEYLRRNEKECREISWQTASTAEVNQLRGYMINDSVATSQNYAAKIIGEDLILRWIVPLEAGETITAMLLVSEFDTDGLYEDLETVPYYLYNAIYYGMYKKILEKLYLEAGNNIPGDMFSTVMSQYRDEQLKLKSYIRNLKTVSSFPQIQPFKWLPED